MSENTKLQLLLAPQVPTLERLMSLNMPQNVDVKAMVMQELEYLNYAAVFKPEILDCLPETIVAGVKTALKKNLTLDPDAGLLYITTRSVKIGGAWFKALEVKPTSDGKISIGRQTGRLLDIQRPWVTYMADGRVDTANVKIQVPAFDEHARPCARWETVTLGYTQFDRLRYFSHKDKSRNKEGLSQDDHARLICANHLYTSHLGWIDPEFACAKVINAAMKRKGTNQNENRVLNLVNNDERFVDPKIENEIQNDDWQDAEELVTTAPPVYQAAPPPPTPPPPAANNAVPPPPPPPPAAQPEANTPEAIIAIAKPLILAAKTVPELNKLWKDNKKAWDGIDIIKDMIKEIREKIKNTPAGSDTPPLPPPPPPAAPSQPVVEADFNIDAPPPPPAATGVDYEMYGLIFACNTADEIRQLYTLHKDRVNKDEALKKFLTDSGKELANSRPKLAIPVQMPGAIDISKEVVSMPPVVVDDPLI